MAIEDYVQTHDNLSLYYKHYNNKKQNIVFLHGLAMDHESWYHQIEFFKKDYSLLLFDLRGHGQSSKPKASIYYTLENLVQDVKTVTEKVNLKRFNLIGFSLGGSIAMKFAQLYPEAIEKLVTINSPYSMDCIKKSFFYKLKFASFIPKELFSLGLDNEPIWKYKNKITTHRKCFTKNDTMVIQNIVNNLKIYQNVSFKFKTKHLFIYSSHDEIVLPKPIPGSNLKIIEKGHHYVIAQKPNNINNIINDFL